MFVCKWCMLESMARALKIYIAGKFDHDYQDLENEYTTLEVEFHNCKYPPDEQEYVKHGLQHDHSLLANR